VSCRWQGAVIEAGLKLAVTAGRQTDADKETVELNPPLTVIENSRAARAALGTDGGGGKHDPKVGVAVALTVRATRTCE